MRIGRISTKKRGVKDVERETEKENNFFNLDKESKTEELSSISRNFDDTNAGLVHSHEIQEQISLILSKVSSISKFLIKENSLEINDYELKKMIEDFKNTILKKFNLRLKVNPESLKGIKKQIKSKTINTIKNSLIKSKGELFCREITLRSLTDFMRYYLTLVPFELKDKEKVSLRDTLRNMYGEPLENIDSMQTLIKILNKLGKKYFLDSKVKRISFNLFGKMKVMGEEEVVVETGDIIPYLTAESLTKVKRRIILINGLIFELLIRQFSFEQINFFCVIYYAKKEKGLKLSNFEHEEQTNFTFVNVE